MRNGVICINYRLPAGRSALEVFRNYEQALRSAGFEVLYSCQDEVCGRGLSYALLTRSFASLSLLHENQRDQKYLAARLSRGGSQIHVALYTVRTYNIGGENRDRIFTQLDVIEAKAMAAGLVQVDAAAMARELARQGGHLRHLLRHKQR